MLAGLFGVLLSHTKFWRPPLPRVNRRKLLSSRRAMCILLGTTRHPDYPLILMNNRDEYFKRPTKLALFEDIPTNPGHRILAPLDEARPEQGTWVGVLTDGRVAVLLNYREGDTRNLQGKMLRGVLPIDYLSAGLSDTDWQQQLQNRHALNGSKIDLEDIGGFTFVYGKVSLDPITKQVKPLSVLTNRGELGQILKGDPSDPHFEISHKKTFGISNSLYYEPWRKVEIGEVLVDKLIDTAVKNEYDEKALVDGCIDVLSTNTYDSDIQKYGGWFAKVQELQNLVFIPPLDTQAEEHTFVLGKYYGTRTQTVILIDRGGNLHYYEKDLHSSDDLEKPPVMRHYTFKINLDEN